MKVIAEYSIDKGCTGIALREVPVLTVTTIVKDPNLSDKVVIEADEKMDPFRLTFSCGKMGKTFVVYFHSMENGGDPSILSQISFTVRVPQRFDVTYE